MAWDIELAKLFKAAGRGEKVMPAVIFGEVKQVDPVLKVLIFDGKATLLDEDLIFSSICKAHVLYIGDRLLLIPLENYKKFIVIDKVG